MTINAYERVSKAIEENVKSLSFNSYRTEDLKEAKEYLKKYEKKSLEIKLIDFDAKILLEVKEYENGLKIISYKQYFEPITVVILIKGNQPIVEYHTKEENKAVEQLIATTTLGNETTDNLLRTIKVTQTQFAYGRAKFQSRPQSILTTFEDLKTDKIILEKHQQYYPISACEWRKTDGLYSLCGSGARDLEVIYRDEQPIYCQLSNKYKVEMIGFNPNNPIDAETCVSYVNDEYDKFISLIDKTFAKENEKTKRLEFIKPTE